MRPPTLQTVDLRLWAYLHKASGFYLKDGKAKVAESSFASLTGWHLPTKGQLETFAKAEGNPHREGQMYRLHGQNYWLTSSGCCDVDDGRWGEDNNKWGLLFATHDHCKSFSNEALLVDFSEREWKLVSPDGRARFSAPAANTRWQGLDAASLMKALTAAQLNLAQPHTNPFNALFSLVKPIVNSIFSLLKNEKPYANNH